MLMLIIKYNSKTFKNSIHNAKTTNFLVEPEKYVKMVKCPNHESSTVNKQLQNTRTDNN